MAQEKILIVDDEIEIAELIEIYLRNEGYNIFQAHHASEALHLLEQEKIHLVILDIMMLINTVLFLRKRFIFWISPEKCFIIHPTRTKQSLTFFSC